MKNITKILLLSLIAITTLHAQKATLKWKTDTLLRVPESVLYDAEHKILYVANIDGKSDGKDGVGFISKVGLDGKIEKLKWVEGLDAPKGLGLFKGKLYVSDITNVAIIDIASAKILKKVEIENAKFLNDITVDKKGTVYISDSNTGKIYALNGDKVELYFENPELKGPNGLLAEANDLYILDFSNGNNFKLSTDKKLTKFGVSSNGADGVVTFGSDGYLVSNWNGEVYHLNAKGEATKILDTKDQKLSAADIEYDAKSKLLFVPTFFGNSVMAYEVK